MCLWTIEDKTYPPEKEVVAWKVMEPWGKGFTFSIFTPEFPRALPKGKWLKAKGKMVIHPQSWLPMYPCGFHAYKTKWEAKKNLSWRTRVVKVMLKGIHTVGTQNARVLVAKWMMILEEGK